jgi:hypothetical protein
MTVDEIAKLIFVLALSFAIAGIAWKLMGLIGELTFNLKEVRTIVRSAGEISRKLTADYDHISEQVKKLTAAIGKVGTNVIEPIVGLFSFLERFKK